jgi:plastocyanin
MLANNLGRNLMCSLAVTAMLVGASGVARAQATNMVVMKKFDFSPMAITIKAGESVTWKNLDGEPHTVTSVDGLFRSGALDQKDSFTFKFDKAGIYKYVCSIHPWMKASVVVQ